jgi:hypothetical protein
MYTMVLMMALSTSGDTASFGKKNGCCGGVVVTSCHGCTGVSAGCTGYTTCHGCYSSCHGSCHGKSGFLGGFLGKKSCHGSSCHGSSCYGSCTGITTGCWGSAGCYGTVVTPAAPAAPATPMPKETPKKVD